MSSHIQDSRKLKKAASFNFTNPKTIFIADRLTGPKIDLPY